MTIDIDYNYLHGFSQRRCFEEIVVGVFFFFVLVAAGPHRERSTKSQADRERRSEWNVWSVAFLWRERWRVGRRCLLV